MCFDPVCGVGVEGCRNRLLVPLLVAVFSATHPLFAAETTSFDRELAAISRRLTPHKPVPTSTVDRLVELSRTATPQRRGRLLQWTLDQRADMRPVLRRVSFEGASLNGVKLARPALAERLKSASFAEAYTSEDYQAGRGVFTAWLAGARLKGARLERVDLHGANLQQADLRAASLRGANLAGAVLNGADLRGADLTGADFRGARLVGAKLGGTRRAGARWQGSTLAQGVKPVRSQVAGAATSEDDSLEFFENRIRPLPIARCAMCHGPMKAGSGPGLDSRRGLLRGGDGRRVVVPEDPRRSSLVGLVRREGKLTVPGLGRLRDRCGRAEDPCAPRGDTADSDVGDAFATVRQRERVCSGCGKSTSHSIPRRRLVP